MKKITAKLLIMASFVLVASCSTTDEFKDVERPKQESIFSGEPEPINGRLDVYNSIARTVKYNLDVATDNMREKLFVTSLSVPKDTLQGIINTQNSSENSLYVGIKALDYAVLYAASNLDINSEFVNDNLYDKAAQNLAKAAIKTHQDALFSIKKGKEIDRIASRESRVLSDLLKKLDKQGRLSPEELAMKKNLEVSLMRFAELRKAFAINVINYGKLVKAEDLDKLELEGKKFYELEDFDRSLSIDVFQHTAFRNREEFIMSRDNSSYRSFDEVNHMMLRVYPEIERLNINGYGIGRPAYVESLQKRSITIASNLIDKVVKYQSTSNVADKERARVEAFDELNLAMFAQIELAYNVVYAANEDLKDIQKTVVELRKRVSSLDNKYRMDPEQRTEYLDDKIRLIEHEAQMSQVLGERAMAIRSLYFYAGFSPFKPKLLKSDVKTMVKELKVSFNKDTVEMLSAVPRKIETAENMGSNNWAKGENWLEELMSGKVGKEPLFEGSEDIFKPYSGDLYNQRKNMQLGAFINRKKATSTWNDLKTKYPELASYNHKIEKVEAGGREVHRIVVHSSQGGMMSICNKLRNDKVECILR